MSYVPYNKKYDSEIIPQAFLEKAKREVGTSVYQIARDWGIGTETIYGWARRYPEFSKAFQEAKPYLKPKPKFMT
jgi:transposase